MEGKEGEERERTFLYASMAFCLSSENGDVLVDASAIAVIESGKVEERKREKRR